MKRIFCIFSVTLLLSCAYTLEATPKKDTSESALAALIAQKDALQERYNQKLTQIEDSKRVSLLASSILPSGLVEGSCKDLIRNEQESINSTREELSKHSSELHALSQKIKALENSNQNTSGGGWLSRLWGSSKE